MAFLKELEVSEVCGLRDSASRQVLSAIDVDASEASRMGSEIPRMQLDVEDQLVDREVRMQGQLEMVVFHVITAGDSGLRRIDDDRLALEY